MRMIGIHGTLLVWTIDAFVCPSKITVTFVLIHHVGCSTIGPTISARTGIRTVDAGSKYF
jgi:hypothetical protein